MAFTIEASRVLAMIIILFSLILFSHHGDLFFFLAGVDRLILWSGTIVLSFSFNSLDCISGLVMLCIANSLLF